MSYTLLDAAYEKYSSKAEFAKNPFRKKKKPSLLRRTGRAARSAAGSVVGKTWAGRGVRAAGLVAGAGLLKRQNNKFAGLLKRQDNEFTERLDGEVRKARGSAYNRGYAQAKAETSS